MEKITLRLSELDMGMLHDVVGEAVCDAEFFCDKEATTKLTRIYKAIGKALEANAGEE